MSGVVVTGFLAPVLLVLVTLIARAPNVTGRQLNGWFDTAFGFARRLRRRDSGRQLALRLVPSYHR